MQRNESTRAKRTYSLHCALETEEMEPTAKKSRVVPAEDLLRLDAISGDHQQNAQPLLPESNDDADLPYDTDEEKESSSREANDLSSPNAKAAVNEGACAAELPDILSKIPAKSKTTIDELNTFLSANMDILGCWIHVERLPRHDAKGFGAVLGGFSLYTFVDGDLRWTRHTTLASLKEIFHSVQRSWYLLKEEHDAVGLLLQNVILDENDQWTTAWLETYCKAFASRTLIMDQDAVVLVWENIGYRLDTHTWFTQGKREDMVSESFNYALNMNKDNSAIDVGAEEEAALQRQFEEILEKRFKVQAFFSMVASMLARRYVEVRAHLIGGKGGNLKSQVADLLEFTFSGRNMRVSNTFFYNMKKEQRQFVIAAMHNKLLVVVNEMQSKAIDATQYKDLLGGQFIQGRVRRQPELQSYWFPGALVWTFNLSNFDMKADRAVTRRTLAVEYTKTFASRPQFMEDLNKWKETSRSTLLALALKYLKRRRGWVRFPPQSYADSLGMLSVGKTELIAWLFTHYTPTEVLPSSSSSSSSSSVKQQYLAIAEIYKRFTQTATVDVLKLCPGRKEMKEFLEQIPYVAFGEEADTVHMKPNTVGASANDEQD